MARTIVSQVTTPRGRPRKLKTEQASVSPIAESPETQVKSGRSAASSGGARPRGRPRKTAQEQAPAKPAIEAAEPDAEEDRQGPNLTTAAYEQLRADVLCGRLRPGEKLGAGALRRRFNIGSSPIREALNRLLSEGLVALEEQKGFKVAPVSEDELRELVTARCWIDGAAVTEAIRRQDSAWEEHIIVALHRLSKTKRFENDWEDKHRAFHAALVGGCGTRWIIRISEQLFDAAERYRMLALDYVPERNELAEHRDIVDACIQQDVDRAVELLAEHYGQTYKVVTSSFLDKR